MQALPASWYTSEEAEIAGIARPPREVIQRFNEERRRCRKAAPGAREAGAGCPLSAGEVVASTAGLQGCFEDSTVAGKY